MRTANEEWMRAVDATLSALARVSNADDVVIFRANASDTREWASKQTASVLSDKCVMAAFCNGRLFDFALDGVFPRDAAWVGDCETVSDEILAFMSSTHQ